MGTPHKIICLTEETVETLYLLGRPDLIQGVSKFVERPPEAKTRHPQVSQFVRSDIERILSLAPDLVIGFSDIQKDIARELIGRGINVFVTNQRSLSEILDQIELLGRMVGETQKALDLVQSFKLKIEETRSRAQNNKIRVYFEEWDHPRLSGIRWVSELIEVCGGVNVFAHKTGSLAKDREVSDAEIIAANPDLILGCWCGKKVNLDSIKSRPGYDAIGAVKSGHLYEVDPAVFLQPGPALFIDGISKMATIFQDVSTRP